MTLSTSRFTWSSTAIADALLGGLQAIDSSTGLIKSWTYAPAMSNVNVPQQPLPLGMNLWCFDSPPCDGNTVEVVIRDFAFVPAGGAGGGGAGLAGASGQAGGGAKAGASGTGGTGGAPAGPAASDSGCGCRVSSSPSSGWLGTAGLLLIFAGRRRRRPT